MSPHSTHERLRPLVAGMVIWAILMQPAAAKFPCCCHGESGHMASLFGACEKTDASLEHSAAQHSCGSAACCHDEDARHPGSRQASSIVPGVHIEIPHRCCRHFCQPTTTAGKPSCTCEVQPDSHAVIHTEESRHESGGGLSWFATIDLRETAIAALVSSSLGDRPPIMGGESPGRVRCVALQRWLI